MKLKITIENRIYEVEVEAFEPEPTPPGGVTPSPAAPPPAAPPEVTSEKVGRSPVAGVVVRIPAQLGQTVQAGDVIIVLEAMKMETNLTASCPGQLRAVHVKMGESVRSGQLLFELE